MRTAKLRLPGLFLFVLVASVAAAQTAAPRPVASHRGGPRTAPWVPRAPLAILYDQTDNDAGVGSSSQDFETAFDAFDDQAADDFVVPAGNVWSIQSAHIPGVYFNGTGPAPNVNVWIYADNSGLPAVAACTYPLLVPSDSAGTFDVTLPTPCVLGPGTYWFSIQARMDFGVGGQWGWEDRSVQSGTASVWQNPGGGFACGPTWVPKTTCIGGSGVDFLFSLSGTSLPMNGVIPPAPPQCVPTTAIASNATPVPIPDLGTAVSTINVTGAGPFLWDLNLRTFITHTFSSDMVITLTSPAGTVVTISSNNGGGADNAFNGTIWDDDAGDTNPPGPVTLNSIFDLVTTTPLAPEEALAAFRGENPNGTWTLTVQDVVGGDSGNLSEWDLQLTTLSQAPGLLFVSVGDATLTPIPDLGNVNATINFPALFTHTCGVRVFTTITHPSSGDLVLTLTSPAGTVVTLTQNNGGTLDNIFNGTMWADNAGVFSPPGPVTDTAFSDGVAATLLAPQEPLGAFAGENPTGTWTLNLADTVGTNTGNLVSWSLEIQSCNCGTAFPNSPVRVDEHGPGSLNGVLEIGETAQVEPSWTNPTSSAYRPWGFASNFTGGAGPTYTVTDNFSDYGPVAPAATANCFDATGNCYAFQITGSRPAQHFDATFDEVLGLVAAPQGTIGGNPFKTWTLHVGESFADVPTGNQFYKYIETIFHKGVTGGCGGGTDYCPGNTVTRAQMAVFLLKSKNGSAYTPPACTGTVFLDVPCTGGIFDPWIEDLAGQGITGGCGGGNYCPTNPVTRAQMSAFLLKTLLTSAYTPPACTGMVFGDVPCTGGIFDPWIEDLAGRGITGGCGGGNYCPGNPNTRGQMAVFLTKTFSLVLYGP